MDASEACLRAFPSATNERIDAYIGSYLRHAPTRPGGSKYKVGDILIFHSVSIVPILDSLINVECSHRVTELIQDFLVHCLVLH